MNDICKYDVIVAGAGLTGSIYARHFADLGKRVLILERREHVGGNLYDYLEDGIYVQKYGPHSFHCNDKKVLSFIKKYAEVYDFILNVQVYMHNKFTPSPFNFKTIDQFYREDEAKRLKEKLLSYFKEAKSATILELLGSNDEEIRNFGKFLYESDYSLYTAKQWGIKPCEVDPNVLKRVPILLNYDEQYFYDTFQFMPKYGFSNFVKNLINNDNIDVKLNSDFLDYVEFKDGKTYLNDELFDGLIIYTGEIDKLFSYKYGALPYRSLKFEFFKENIFSYQNAPIVAYPEAKNYTRITEFKKFLEDSSGIPNTIYVVEYPQKYEAGKNEPYYPINNDNSNKVHMRYMEEASKYKNLKISGRLGWFKYFNMDKIILNVLNDIELNF